MGAEEIAAVSTGPGLSSTKWSGMEVEMSPDGEETHRKALQELADDNNDPDFFTDNLGAESRRFQLSGDAEANRKSEAKEAD